MRENKIAAIILAAGLGKRMKSGIPKVLHPVAGMPMIYYVVDAAKDAGAEQIVVVAGHKGDVVRERMAAMFQDAPVSFAAQEPQLGTGHAVMCAEENLKSWKGNILILSGDVPLITKETINGLLHMHESEKAAISFISAIVSNPAGYGRVVRNKKRMAEKIVEDRDASIAEKKINEINTGIYCVSAQFLFDGLKKIKQDNAQAEYYLTDLIAIAAGQRKRIACLTHMNPAEVMGVNNRVELAEANEEMRERINNDLMLSGVTLIDDETAYIQRTVTIGKDTTVYPNVFLEGRTAIGENCVIEEGCKIIASVIGDGAVIKSHSIIESSRIGNNVSIGPFARLRPECIIEDNAKVGNFVEVKKSKIGKGTKANHLSYIGDAVIGEDVNIGAGMITCNYDGVKKHQTIIEDNAFIGSDTQLVAPVKVGQNAYIGSGSTITRDVPPGSLALSRAEQRIVEGWVERKGMPKKDKGQKKER